MLQISLQPRGLHSGADRDSYLNLLAKEHAAALIHARVARQPRLLALLQRLQQEHHLFFALDAGYTKKMTLEQYAALLNSLQKQAPNLFSWYANYDSVGDQVASDANYDQLLFLSPECRDKIVWIYQCQWGTRAERVLHLRRLEAMCRRQAARKQRGRLIGVGALVPIIKRSVADALIMLQEIGEILNSFFPWVQAHVFGLSSWELVFYLRSQPWVASIDSSKWLIGWKAREVLLWSGEQMKATALRLPLTPEECAAINIRVLDSWLNPSRDFQRAGAWVLPPLDLEHAADLYELSAIRRFFVRQHGKAADLFFPSSMSWSERPRRILYLPLFIIGEREYGLVSHSDEHSIQAEQDSPITAEWSVIWDVQEDEAAPTLLLMDGRLKSGYVTHEASPHLCHYPFSTAVIIAKSFYEQDLAA